MREATKTAKQARKTKATAKMVGKWMGGWEKIVLALLNVSKSVETLRRDGQVNRFASLYERLIFNPLHWSVYSPIAAYPY